MLTSAWISYSTKTTCGMKIPSAALFPLWYILPTISAKSVRHFVLLNNVMKPLIRKVDCVRLYVPDLEEGLAFYRDQLGHELIWRTEMAAGLRLPETEAELVLQTEDQRQEVDLLVDSADEAAKFVEQAGGRVIVPPFDIQIGRCV